MLALGADTFPGTTADWGNPATTIMKEQFTTGRTFIEVLLTSGFQGTLCKMLPSSGHIWHCNAHLLTLSASFSTGFQSRHLYFSNMNNIFIIFYCKKKKKKMQYSRYRTLSWQLVTFCRLQRCHFTKIALGFFWPTEASVLYLWRNIRLDTGCPWMSKHGARAWSVLFLSPRAMGYNTASTPVPITICNAYLPLY